MVPKDSQPLGTTLFQWTFLLLVAGTLATGAFYLYNNSRLSAQSVDTVGDDTVPAVPPSRSPNSVAALGEIEPQGEIIRLSAPSALDSVKIDQLMVDEGDWVEKGEVVAILDGRDRRQAALDRAKTEVQVARAKLGRVRAGNSDGDIGAQRSAVDAQRAAIARFEAELENAEIELDRNQRLLNEGAISQSVLDAKRLTRDVARRQLDQAKDTLAQAQNTLASVSEVRPEDVNISEAEVASAEAAVKQAEADLDLVYIRASTSGQVLKVHSRPGEIVGQQGVAEIAQTNQMNVVAQVYETDIKKVKLGQRATISSTSLDTELKGEVIDISRQVIRQNVFENNPFADTGNRVIEVKIRLDGPSSRRVSSLSNMQVQVVINTKP